MRKWLAVLTALVLSAPAYADSVQFIVQQPDGQRSYAAVVPVLVMSGNRWTRFGYTDRFGRIFINLPPGHYQFLVQGREREFRTTVQITGSNNLRSVLLR